MPRHLGFMIFALILCACTAPVKNTIQPTATIDIPAIMADAAATAYMQLTETAISQSQTVVPPTPEKTPTPAIFTLPGLTPIPSDFTTKTPTTLDPAEIPNLLQSSITIETLTPLNDHKLQRVTGWERGFIKFSWVDSNHLLLRAVTGLGGELSSPPSYPLMVKLDSQEIRIPRLREERIHGEYLSRWSSRLDAFITTETTSSGEAVTLYSKTWDVIATYPGELLSISPTGTKVIFKSGILIDLINGKQIDLKWNIQHPDESLSIPKFDEFLSIPNWSDDESRIFTCCYFYNDLKIGENFNSAEYDHGGSIYAGGTWMLNDQYFLPDCCLAGGLPAMGLGYIPLFDSSTKTFLKVNELTGIPPTMSDGRENSCYMWSTAPDKKHIWAECYDGSHLINLATFESQPFPESSGNNGDAQWSANSQFALISGYDAVQILSVTDKTLKSLPSGYHCDWTPDGKALLCRSNQGQTLSLLDARTLNIQKSLDFSSGIQDFFWSPDNKLLVLSKENQSLFLLDSKTFTIQKELSLSAKVRNLYWSPDGKSVAVLAWDSSFWRFDYPGMENLEQLTPSMPVFVPKVIFPDQKFQVGDVFWSPDSAFLALRAYGDKDIYIVDTRARP